MALPRQHQEQHDQVDQAFAQFRHLGVRPAVHALEQLVEGADARIPLRQRAARKRHAQAAITRCPQRRRLVRQALVHQVDAARLHLELAAQLAHGQRAGQRQAEGVELLVQPRHVARRALQLLSLIVQVIELQAGAARVAHMPGEMGRHCAVNLERPERVRQRRAPLLAPVGASAGRNGEFRIGHGAVSCTRREAQIDLASTTS
ncbi:hypothetical protein G6F24_015521 [Rhizopus arrhizus]|nr:hypothetical protein G6F24_015521 [Rhizopus arrhizus]